MRAGPAISPSEVGIKEVDEHIWFATFLHYTLEYFDDETGRLELRRTLDDETFDDVSPYRAAPMACIGSMDGALESARRANGQRTTAARSGKQPSAVFGCAGA